MKTLIKSILLYFFPEPELPKKGDTVRIVQPGFAYHGYTGTVIYEPNKDGFFVSNGDSIVSCPMGCVLKAINKTKRRFGVPLTKTTYEIIKPDHHEQESTGISD